jgi:G3E family GTPase
VDEIDYVILEASGVADPEGIVMTFLAQKYEGLLRLDSITCVADAEAIFSDGDDAALSYLKIRQIGYSDLVILNKVDLVTPTHVEVVREWIGAHLNRIRIVEAVHCDVPLEILLAVGRFDPENMVRQTNNINIELGDAAQEPHSAGEMFETWSFETEQPLDLDRLQEMVRRELPASIYRCKGILYSYEQPGKRFALQIVGRRTEIVEVGKWGNRKPCTKIVAIGSARETDPVLLTSLFDTCINETEEASQ